MLDSRASYVHSLPWHVFIFLRSYRIEKEGPRQETDDDGIEHFRRIEFVCVEDRAIVVSGR